MPRDDEAGRVRTQQDYSDATKGKQQELLQVTVAQNPKSWMKMKRYENDDDIPTSKSKNCIVCLEKVQRFDC